MIIIILVTLVMVGATVCTLTKQGEKERICNYDQKNDN